MKRKEIVLGAVLSVFILVSTSVLANTLQTDIPSPSKDALITDKIEPKELLFQTIIDMAKNKDIQNLVENSEIEIQLNKEKSTLLVTNLFMKNPKLLFSMMFARPVLSKDYLNYAYSLGVKLSDTLDTSEIKSIADCIHIKNPRIQEEITNIIEKNDELNKKIEEISYLECDCLSMDNTESTSWDFPVICTILGIILFFTMFLFMIFRVGDILIELVMEIGDILGCPFV